MNETFLKKKIRRRVLPKYTVPTCFSESRIKIQKEIFPVDTIFRHVQKYQV